MGELLIRRSTPDPSGRTALSLPGLPRAGEPTVGSGITLDPRPRSRAKWHADSSPPGPGAPSARTRLGDMPRAAPDSPPFSRPRYDRGRRTDREVRAGCSPR